VSQSSYLDELEHRSIYVIREARAKIKNLAMLWSIGKDSTVLLWLVRKAFFGHVPFPMIHIDTTKKIPEMIAFRDRVAKEWNLDLIVGKNEEALAAGMGPHLGKVTCCGALKKDGLQQVLEKHKFRGILLGIRRDEDGTRAKERYFSPRDKNFEWIVANQPPELWDQFMTDFDEGTHVRIHPLLHWTEVNIWEYIEREKIPVIDLYFSKEGKRYRSLGCAPCTGTIDSHARSVPEIIVELRHTKISERSGRAQDKESEDAFERLRAAGYM
jgi:sulfate adenylyltransferase subunit 2